MKFSCKDPSIATHVKMYGRFLPFMVAEKDNSTIDKKKKIKVTPIEKLGVLFVSQNPTEVYASHSPGWILGCAYTVCSYG